MRVGHGCAAAGALLAAACGEPGQPPYAFGAVPEQRFRLETRAHTVIDGASADVERVAELRLRALSLERAGVELEMYLERYYERVTRPAAPEEEVAISPEGVVVRRGDEELRLGPGDRTPSAASVRELLGRAAGGVVLDARGAAGEPWRSHDPLLADLAPLEWLLLALPVLDPGASWRGRRRVPQIGRYRLGLELPLVYERETDGVRAIAMSGFAERGDLRVADGLRGELGLELQGRVELDSLGRLASSALELELRFSGSEGAEIRSTQRVRITCLDCAGAFNSPAQAPDLPGE